MTNDIVYTYRGSWCAEGLPTSWECDWRFIGREGSMTWDGGSHYQVQTVKQREKIRTSYQNVEIPEYQASDIGGHAGLIQEFFACIQNGTQPETNAVDNIKSLAMVFGAIESAEKGCPIKMAW